MASATNVMKLVKGDYDFKLFDEKNSVLPKWLLEKGMMNYHDFLRTKIDIQREIEFHKKSANRKNRSKKGKKVDLYMVKRAKKDLSIFSIEYFNAEDVEEAWRKFKK